MCKPNVKRFALVKWLFGIGPKMTSLCPLGMQNIKRIRVVYLLYVSIGAVVIELKGADRHSVQPPVSAVRIRCVRCTPEYVGIKNRLEK